jgi:hypothetical protein
MREKLYSQGISAEDVHNAWVAWMVSKGVEHESIVPFSELPAATQTEDSPFVLAIRSVARTRGEADPSGA